MNTEGRGLRSLRYRHRPGEPSSIARSATRFARWAAGSALKGRPLSGEGEGLQGKGPARRWRSLRLRVSSRFGSGARATGSYSRVLAVAVRAKRDAEITRKLDALFADERQGKAQRGGAAALDRDGTDWTEERW
jgi:hypothetical protein